MKRQQIISDYGGYQSGRRGHFRSAKKNCASFRCGDCGHMQFVTRAELNRAARPKCFRCGGLLTEETKASHKRTLEKNDAVALAKGMVTTRIERANCRCPYCGLGFFTTFGLGGHSAEQARKKHLPICEEAKGLSYNELLNLEKIAVKVWGDAAEF